MPCRADSSGIVLNWSDVLLKTYNLHYFCDNSVYTCMSVPVHNYVVVCVLWLVLSITVC